MHTQWKQGTFKYAAALSHALAPFASKNRGYLVYVHKTRQPQQKNQRHAPKKQKKRLRDVLTEPKKDACGQNLCLTESNPQEDKPK